MIIIYSIALVVLVMMSAFFSSSETSLMSINKIQLKQYQSENRKGIKKIVKIKSNMDTYLTLILIGNNFVNTLASSLATALAISIVGQNGIGLATIGMTVLLIIFGEILPKNVASFYSYQIARRFSPILVVCKNIFYPLVWIFSLLTKAINKIESVIFKKDKPLVTEAELKTLIEVGNSEGTLECGEKNMLNKIFEFSDLRVRDIMKPKALVVGISDDSSYEEVKRAFSSSGYSRLPVFHESLDSVIGIIHFKELLFSGCESKSQYGKKFDLLNATRNATYVPETISAISVLRLLKKEKQNIAIVVDEHGSNCGIVTMDDILRSVFGRITDNFDDTEGNPVNRIQIITPNRFRIPGEIKLDDFNSVFSTKLTSEEFDTLAGWLLEQFGYLPSTGEAIRRNKITFSVEDQAQRRIKSVIISLT